MYNLLLSLAAGALVAFLVKLLHFNWWAAALPGMLVFLGAFILLARRIGLKLQALAAQAQKELPSSPVNARERQQRVERAIRILEQGLALERWQFLVGGQVHGQIGMLRYALKDLEGAAIHLARANPRDGLAQAFQGALLFQKKDVPAMEKAFEAAVKSSRKDGLIWATYAWCLLQIKEKDKALRVMGRAVEQNPSDERLKAGLSALQNDKKLKMKPYEPNWWQFGLEQPPVEFSGGRRVQFQRR